MKDFRPLDEQERAAIERAREIFNSYPKVPCTACGYCMKVCPQHIAIREELKKAAELLEG